MLKRTTTLEYEMANLENCNLRSLKKKICNVIRICVENNNVEYGQSGDGVSTFTARCLSSNERNVSAIVYIYRCV